MPTGDVKSGYNSIELGLKTLLPHILTVLVQDLETQQPCVHENCLSVTELAIVTCRRPVCSRDIGRVLLRSLPLPAQVGVGCIP